MSADTPLAGSASGLVARLEHLGIRIDVANDRLRIDSPVGALTPELTAEIRASKAALLELLGPRTQPQASMRDREHEPMDAPLSYAQHGLFVLDKMRPGNPAYVMHSVRRLKRELDPQVLESSLAWLVRRHETLRTVFILDGTKALQRILPSIVTPLEWYDVGDLAASDRDSRASELASRERLPAFSLASGPLFLLRVIRLGANEFLLSLGMHHIISDAWSLDVFYRELAFAYSVYERGASPQQPELGMQYRDFAGQQRDRFAAGALEASIAFWKRTLADPPSLLDGMGAREPGVRTMTCRLRLVAELRDDLLAAARAMACSAPALLLSVFMLVLARRGAGRDVPVIVPVSGRTRLEHEAMIGLFTSAVVVRVGIDPAATFRQLAERVGRATSSAMQHQEVSLEALEGLLRQRREAIPNLKRLSKIAFNFFAARSTAGSTLDAVPVESSRAQPLFDLMLDLVDTLDGLEMKVEIVEGLFDPGYGDELLRDFRSLAQEVISSTGASPLRRMLSRPAAAACRAFSPRAGFAISAQTLRIMESVAATAGLSLPQLIRGAYAVLFAAATGNKGPCRIRVCNTDGTREELVLPPRMFEADCEVNRAFGNWDLPGTASDHQGDDLPLASLAFVSAEEKGDGRRVVDHEIGAAASLVVLLFGNGGMRWHFAAVHDFPGTAFCRRLSTVIRGLTRGMRLSQIELLLPGERRDIERLNRTYRRFGGPPCVHEAVYATAAESPGKIAVETATAQTSYAELAETARVVAASVASRFRKGTYIGVMMERSQHLPAAILGILASGCVYVPFDARWPAMRLAQCARAAGVAAMLIGEDTPRAKLPDTLEVLRFPLIAVGAHHPESGALQAVSDTDVAYAMFTSGTTGAPKAVAVTHGALSNVLRGLALELETGSQDVFLAQTTATFDISLVELLLPLLLGGKMVVVTQDDLKDFRQVAGLMTQKGVTVVQATPSAWRLLLETEWNGGGMKALSGGEPLSAALASALARRVPRVWNLYGPTECTVWATGGRVADHHGEPDVGRPLANVRAYVLDRCLRVLPPGFRGELFIAGAGLACGYVGDEERTEARFIQCAVMNGPLERMYRTGDLAMLDRYGRIRFLGRMDRQIKLRGHRIEPQDIERSLCMMEGVEQAVVLAVGEGESRRLRAYAACDGAVSPEAMRAWLAQRYPESWVPDRVVPLSRMPRLPNGKVDERALAAIADEPGPAVAPPSTQLQGRIHGIWAQLLGRSDFGVHDNFFEIGGHSILMIRAHGLISSLPGVHLDVLDAFEHPTVSGLAARITRGAASDESREADDKIRGMPVMRPVAVIGMAGRFPGAHDLADFWRNLLDGTESIVSFTEADLLEAGAPVELVRSPDYVKAAAPLDEVELFDAEYFGISPKEAEYMDPQHRLLLECAHGALEDSGYAPPFPRQRVGIFGGAGFSSYLLSNLIRDAQLMASLSPMELLYGNDKDYAAARAAHRLDLHGPCVGLGTACSTGLVAVHQACQSLGSGECDMAIAAAAKVMTPQRRGYVATEGGILSRSGHCRPFDDRADGTVFGSGVCAIVLKPLDAAIRDRDSVYAVVTGSAINNDGTAKATFTAPSRRAQAEVIRRAFASAGVLAPSAGYIESHGTATPVGDRIEIAALCDAFSDGRNSGDVLIGSVKSNVGHLDPVAGLAGLTKTVLAIHHGVIPPMAGGAAAGRSPLLAGTPFAVNAKPEPWGDRPPRAGVSSFGIGGTNAHVVVEPYRRAEERTDASSTNALIVLSARSADALAASRSALARRLQETARPTLQDVAFTLQVGRQAHRHRWWAVARGTDDAIRLLESGGNERQGIVDAQPEIIFRFSGDTGWSPGVAAILYRQRPAFAAALDALLGAIPRGGRSERMRDVLVDPAARDVSPEERSIATFLLEVASAQMWMDFGAQPGAAAGRGVGESCAAYIAGAVGLDEALRGLRTSAAAETSAMAPMVSPDRKPDHIRIVSVDDELLRSGASLVLPVGVQDARATGAADMRDATCHDHQAGDATLQRALGELWSRGAPLDWSRVNAGCTCSRVHLPGYPFERRRHWHEIPAEPTWVGRADRPREVVDNLQELSWQRKSVVRRPRAVAPWPGVWLVVRAHDDGASRAFLAALRRNGETAVDIVHGSRERIGNDECTIDLHDEAALARMLRHIGARPAGFRLGMWVDNAQVFDVMVGLSKALLRVAGEVPVQWAIVLRDAWNVILNDPLDPDAARAAAASRVLTCERSALRCCVVDSGTVAMDQFAESLLDEFDAGLPHAMVAYRAGVRWSGVIQGCELPLGGPSFRRGGQFLVTGGLGAIGMEICRYLHRGFAPRIVSIGRSDPHDEDAAGEKVRRRLAELREEGIQIEYRQADVSDRAAVFGVLSDLRRNGPIDAVFHLAGVPDGKPVDLRKAGDIEAVSAPKVRGARLLSELLLDAPETLLVLFSSVTAVEGAPGQLAYAAGNAFMDALAGFDRSRGRSTISIGWDAWADVGMAVEATLPRALRDQRLAAIKQWGLRTSEALAALDRILAARPAHVLVSRRELSVDVSRRKESGGKTPSEFSHSDAMPADIEKELAVLWSRALGIEAVSTTGNFFDQGGDSLIAVRLASDIRRRLSCDISPEDLLEDATISGLARRIARGRETAAVSKSSSACRLHVLREGHAGSAPVVLVHPLGGEGLVYRDLAAASTGSRTLYGVSIGRACRYGTLEEMASAYGESLVQQGLTGPIHLAGASFGGMLAYEMARGGEAHELTIQSVLLIDTPGPRSIIVDFATDAQVLSYLASIVARHPMSTEELQAQSPERLFDYFLDRALNGDSGPARMDAAALRDIVANFREHHRLMREYRVLPSPVPIGFVKARERRAGLDPEHPEREWASACRRMKILHCPGNHVSMLQPPNVAQLARLVEEALSEPEDAAVDHAPTCPSSVS